MKIDKCFPSLTRIFRSNLPGLSGHLCCRVFGSPFKRRFFCLLILIVDYLLASFLFRVLFA